MAAQNVPEAAETLDAARFRHTRRARQAEVAEDYVELIAELHASGGEARAVDIARTLGVSHATVVKTLARLNRDGFVRTRPYRGVFLTDQGRSLATTVRDRHETVVAFLLALGVPPEAAEVDSEGIEHYVGEETLAAFRRFLDAHARRKETGRPADDAAP